MRKRKNFQVGLMQLSRVDKLTPEYVPALVAARVLYLSRTLVLRYFASGELKGFRAGLGKTAAIKIARSSIIEFGANHQGRTITPAEIDQWLEE
jgi:hypothetical protein